MFLHFKFISIILILNLVNIQTISNNLNTCSTSLGNYMPKMVGDCTSDKSTIGKKCCYVSTKSANVQLSMCILISQDTNTIGVEDVAANYGATAVFDCHSAFYTNNFIIFLILTYMLI